MQTVVSARVERDLLRASVAWRRNPFIASAVRGIVGRSVPVRVLPTASMRRSSPPTRRHNVRSKCSRSTLVHGKEFDDPSVHGRSLVGTSSIPTASW